MEGFRGLVFINNKAYIKGGAIGIQEFPLELEQNYLDSHRQESHIILIENSIFKNNSAGF